jgi:regulator of cell morphogenesis and NO signaling
MLAGMSAELLVPQTLVRDILQRVPGAPRAFERHRVDYCCHGDLSVAEASQRVGADGAAVLAALAEEAARPDAEPAWGDSFERMPLSEVVAHLVTTVHPKARADVSALRALMPAEGALAEAVGRLCDELEPHLAFEERYLFPYVKTLDETGRVPPALFDTVLEPCRMLLREHEASDHVLDTLRALTQGYRAPDGADASTVALYRLLADYDRALVLHMHIEGNALFPRAQQLEAKFRASTPRRSRR